MKSGLKRWWYNWTHPEGIHPWRWRFLRLWIIVVSAFLIVSYHRQETSVQSNKDRIADTRRQAHRANLHNKARIAEIQHSRILSCRTNYESIREVFKPFFPPKGHRTAKQVHDLNKFNKIIDRKKAKCIKQVQPKENK